jgi:hypothetical protein
VGAGGSRFLEVTAPSEKPGITPSCRERWNQRTEDWSDPHPCEKQTLDLRQRSRSSVSGRSHAPRSQPVPPAPGERFDAPAEKAAPERRTAPVRHSRPQTVRTQWAGDRESPQKPQHAVGTKIKRKEGVLLARGAIRNPGRLTERIRTKPPLLHALRAECPGRHRRERPLALGAAAKGGASVGRVRYVHPPSEPEIGVHFFAPNGCHRRHSLLKPLPLP